MGVPDPYPRKAKMPTPRILIASLFLSASVALSAPQTLPEPPSRPESVVSAAAASEPVLMIPELVVPTTTTTTTEPPPPTTTTTQPPPIVTRQSASPGDPNDEASWDRLAQCESGGDWAINTGNGYYGGLQFSLSSWRSVGGTGYPHEHSRATQIAMGQQLHAQGGWNHWPGCSRKFGWI